MFDPKAKFALTRTLGLKLNLLLMGSMGVLAGVVSCSRSCSVSVSDTIPDPDTDTDTYTDGFTFISRRFSLQWRAI